MLDPSPVSSRALSAASRTDLDVNLLSEAPSCVYKSFNPFFAALSTSANFAPSFLNMGKPQAPPFLRICRANTSGSGINASDQSAFRMR